DSAGRAPSSGRPTTAPSGARGRSPAASGGRGQAGSDRPSAVGNAAEGPRPGEALASFRRGNAHPQQRRYDRALAEFTAALRRDLGRNDDALRDYDQAIRLAPRNAEAYHIRGVACLNLRDDDRALADFTEAIRLDPGNALYYKNRANVFARRGDSASAEADRE